MPREPGVRLELGIDLHPEAAQGLQSLFHELGLGACRCPRRQRVRIALTERSRRLDVLSGGPLGARVTFIETAGSACWIQHDARVFVPIPRERGKRARKGKGGEARAEARGDAGRAEPVQASKRAPAPKAVSATLVDRRTGRTVRLAAELDPERQAPELAPSAVRALFAGPSGEPAPGFDAEAWAEAFASGGFPTAYTLEALDPGAEPTVLSRVRVAAFRAEPIDDRDFAPPQGYRRWTLGAKAPPRGAKGYTRLPARELAVPSEATGGAGGGGGGEGGGGAAQPGDVGVSRQALDDEGFSGRDPADRPPTKPRPTPMPMTLSPRIGLRIEQGLLNDLAAIFNAALTPIRTISAGQGEVVLDWLTQLRNDVLTRGASAPGTAVFQLLHDVALPATRVTPAPTPASDFGSFSCRGLIDQVALRDAETRFRTGSYPQTITMTFPPTMRTVISRAGADWDLLPDGVKARMAFELVRREYGAIRVPFPTGTGPKPILGLLNIQATNVQGALTLPPVPPPAMTGDPRFNPLLSLTAGPNGTISGTLALGTLGLTATILRWGTVDFYLLAAASFLAILVLPGLAWALSILGSLMLFVIQDVVLAALVVRGMSAALSIRFVQGPTGAFLPSVTCTLGGSITFAWLSLIPTGINQVVTAIETALVNVLGGAIMGALSNGIAGKVAGAVTELLGVGFPASALKLGLPIAGGTTGGRAGVYTYVEARLDPSRDSRFAISAVSTPADLETAQRTDVTRAVPLLSASHYGSLSFDENFLNVTLAGFRVARLLDDLVTGPLLTAAKAVMPPPLPSAATRTLTLTADSNPAMTLAAAAAGSALASHGTVRIPYVIALNAGPSAPIAFVRFRVDTIGQLVLGSAIPPGGSGLIRIQSLADRAFDLLLELAGAVITPLSVELVTTTDVRTESIDYDSRGKPHRTVEIDRIQTTTPVPLTPAFAQALDPFLRLVVTDAWSARRTVRAPRRDGVTPGANTTGTPDPLTSFRYPLGDLDPDAIVSQPNARVELGLERRLAHFHLGHAGIATGALLPIRTGSSVPLLATFTSTNSVPGILGSVIVRASRTSDRPLTL